VRREILLDRVLLQQARNAEKGSNRPRIAHEVQPDLVRITDASDFEKGWLARAYQDRRQLCPG
jgi:hypothetical protein